MNRYPLTRDFGVGLALVALVCGSAVAETAVNKPAPSASAAPTLARPAQVQSGVNKTGRLNAASMESLQQGSIKPASGGGSSNSAPVPGASRAGENARSAPNDTKGRFGPSGGAGSLPGSVNPGRAPAGFGSSPFGGVPQGQRGSSKAPAGLSGQPSIGTGSASRSGASGGKASAAQQGRGDPRLRDDSSSTSVDLWDEAENAEQRKKTDAANDRWEADKEARDDEAREQYEERQRRKEWANKPVEPLQEMTPPHDDLGSGDGFGDGGPNAGGRPVPRGERGPGSGAGRPGMPSAPSGGGGPGGVIGVAAPSSGLSSGDGFGVDGGGGRAGVKPTTAVLPPKTEQLINPGAGSPTN